MTTNNQYLRSRIEPPRTDTMPSPDVLRAIESCGRFRRLCANRLALGAMRYGRMCDPQKPQYDRVQAMIVRLERYLRDRNAEHLVDVANLAELEFAEGNHRGVTPIDDGEHVKPL